MSLSDFVDVTILEQAIATQVASFTDCMHLVQVPVATLAARYASYTSVPEATSAGLPAPALAAATKFFSQEPNPGRLIIGRRGEGTAQQSLVTITTAAAGTWSWDLGVDTVSYLAGALDTEQEIAEGLHANAVAQGLYTRYAVTADDPTAGVITIDADVAGDAFTIGALTVPGAGAGATSTPAVNVAAEDISDALDAVRTAGAVFYGFTIESSTEASIDEASGWAAAQTDPVSPALFFGRTSDVDVRDGTVGNLASDLFLLSYDTTHLMWTKDVSSFPDVAMMARGLAADLDQQSITLALKGLIGVTSDAGPGVESPLSSAQITNVQANANSYTLEGGLGTTFPGKVSSGKYTDTVISRHWLRARLQEAGFQALRGTPTKVPYDRAGAAVLEGAFRGVMAVAEAAQHVQSGWTISIPNPATLTSTQRASRNLPGVVISAVFRGAIHSTSLTVYLSF